MASLYQLLASSFVAFCVAVDSQECMDNLMKTCNNANEQNCETELFKRECKKACTICPVTSTATSVFTALTVEVLHTTTKDPVILTTADLSTSMTLPVLSTTDSVTQTVTQQTPVCTWSGDNPSATFQDLCIAIHNYYRCLHGSPSVTRNLQLESSAQSWAEHLASIDMQVFSNTADIGENLYYLSQAGRTATADDAIVAWYTQYFLYDFNNHVRSVQTDEFTQVIWKSTSSIGCGRTVKGRDTYIVVHYFPQGNLPGDFIQNVQKVKADICEANCGTASYCQGLDPESSTCIMCDNGYSRCTGLCIQYCPKPENFNGFWREWCRSDNDCSCDATFNYFTTPPIFPGAKCS